MQLDGSALAAGIRLVALDTVGSTNAEALGLARAGESGPLWVTARRQTAGRGRRGRTWVSEAGNLYATLMLTGPCAPERAAQLSFVAALAVHDAVAQHVPSLASRLTLKWPNDLLIDGAKIAGILVEGETLAAREFAVAIGVGLNCARHPADTPYPATDFSALGMQASPQTLFRILSATFLRRSLQWDRGHGFAGIRQDWLLRADGIGEPIRVRSSQYEIEGTFAALDSQGHLVLAHPDGTTQRIAAGEVFPGVAYPSRLSGVFP